MWQWAEAMTVNNRKREGEKRKATHWPQNVLTLASARLERESGPRGPFACLLASFSLSFHRLLTIAASAGFQFSAPRLHRRPGQIRRSQQLLCFWPRRPPPSRMSDERNNYLILTLFLSLSLNLPPLAAWGSDAVRVLSFSLSKPNWKSASRAVLHSDYAALYLFGSIGVLAFFFFLFWHGQLSLSLSNLSLFLNIWSLPFSRIDIHLYFHFSPTFSQWIFFPGASVLPRVDRLQTTAPATRAILTLLPQDRFFSLKGKSKNKTIWDLRFIA